MRFVRFPLLLAATALAVPGVLPAVDTPAEGLYGVIKRETYIAPGEAYRVALPVLPELGGQVSDTENVVTFSDDISTHISIASFPLDAGQLWEITDHGKRAFLTSFYTTQVMRDFQQRFPGSSLESTLFSPDLLEGAVIGFALLPGGSSFAKALTVPGINPPPPPVAKRGNLLFVRGGRIFIVSMELAERVTQPTQFHKSVEEENALLRDRLIRFTNRIRFPAPPAPKKK